MVHVYMIFMVGTYLISLLNNKPLLEDLNQIITGYEKQNSVYQKLIINNA